MAGGVDGLALGTIAAGGLFLYAAIQGKSLLSTVQALIKGQAPSKGASANPIPIAADIAGAASAAAGSVTLGGGGSASGQAIATDALKYSGTGYVWGGHADAPGDWDCSSFVSYVLGHDFGIKLPGGGTYGSQGYPPNAHGPATVQYMLYGQGIPYGQEQPGDLVVSTVHMGIVIGNGQMISAQDAQLGTGVAGYRSGFPGGQPIVRRAALWTAWRSAR